MAQAIILAAAQTVAVSTDVIVTSPCDLSLFWGGAVVPDGVSLGVYQVSNATEILLGLLTPAKPVFQLPLPGTYRVKRGDVSALGINIGVASDSGASAVGMQYPASNAGAASTVKVATVIGTNATSVKASAGRVLGFTLTNTTASFKYVAMFDKATAPTVGTDVPKYKFGLPPNSTSIKTLEGGIGYSVGIAFAITGGLTDLDATNTAVNDVIGAFCFA
jgi:hypothetical protein